MSILTTSEPPTTATLPAGSVCCTVTVQRPSSRVGSVQVAATAEHVTVVAPGLVALMVVVASASYGLTVKVGVVVRVMLPSVTLKLTRHLRNWDGILNVV